MGVGFSSRGDSPCWHRWHHCSPSCILFETVFKSVWVDCTASGPTPEPFAHSGQGNRKTYRLLTAARNLMRSRATLDPDLRIIICCPFCGHEGHSTRAPKRSVVIVLRDPLNGPNGHDTLIIVTYDEFGGAWDHVPPPPFK